MIWSSRSLPLSLYLGLLGCVATANPVRAQTASLSGTVVDTATALPVRGAVVSIDSLALRAETSPNGTFRIRLPHGRHVLSVRAVGYEPAVHQLTIADGPPAVLEITLHAQAFRLREIQVLRDRTEMSRYAGQVSGSARVIGQDDFEDANTLHGDIHQLMRRVPGTNVQEEEGYGLRPNIGLRGSGSERSSKITVMEDGVLIAPAPYAAPAAYYFPKQGRMAGVEVRKGASQVKYGPRTVGGAVNLLSARIPEDLSLELDAAGGSNATTRVSGLAGASHDNVGWLAQAYHVNTSGFKTIDRSSPRPARSPQATGYDLTHVMGKVRFNTASGRSLYQELELKAGYYDETSDETYLGLTNSDFTASSTRRYAASQLDKMKAEQWQLQARHFLRVSNRVDVTTTLYHNSFSRNWYKLQSVGGAGLGTVLDDPASYPDEYAVLTGGDSGPDHLQVRANNRSYFGRGVQSVLGVRLGRAGYVNQIELGLRYHADSEDRFQWQDGFRMVSGSMVETTAGVHGSQANRVSGATAFAGYVQDEMAFGRWIVTPGVRFERIVLERRDYPTNPPSRAAPDRVRQNTVTIVVPGLGASVAIGGGMTLFAGVHRGFNPPGPSSVEEVRAETSVNYEFGARVSRTGVAAELVGFYTDYANVLGTSTLATGADGTGDQHNGGAATVLGVEGSISFDPLALSSAVSIPLALSLTYTSARFDTSFESAYEPWGQVRAADRMPYIPELALHTSAGLAVGPWQASAVATYTSAMRTIAGQGEIGVGSGTDAAWVLNVSGEYQVTAWRTSLFAAVRNLLDNAYIVARRPAGVRPGLPRTVLGGVRVRL